MVKEAYALFKKRRYRECAEMLERLAPVAMGPYPIFLQALCCLLSDQLNKVEGLLRKLKASDPAYLPAVQLELFLFLKSAGDRGAALSRYLDAFQRFPADPFVRHGLKQVRDTADFPAFQRQARLHEFVSIPHPRAGIARSRKRFLSSRIRLPVRGMVIGCVIAVIAAAAALLIWQRQAVLQLFRMDVRAPAVADSRDVDIVTIEMDRHDLINKVQREKTRVFYYSNEEIFTDFNEARRRIKGGSFNEALVLLNRILSSNANFSVKEKAEYLRRFVMNRDDREYSAVSFAEASRDPYLYTGVLVRWRGRVANLTRKDGRMSFHLLAGYRGRDTFSGIAEVYSERDFASIQNGNLIELGALLRSTIGSENRVYLVAREIKRLGEPAGDQGR